MMKVAKLLPCLLILTSCTNFAQLKTIAELPKSLRENSGMVMLSENHIWVQEDSGNKNELYEINLDGEITRTVEIKKAKNIDWEDLTKDDEQRIYIGDFGNNKNKRKNLTIYRIPNLEKTDKDKVEAEKIKFSYPDQKKFPYKKHKRIYDCEAFFYFDNHLYLFTKNRSDPYFSTCSLYKIPAKPGNYEAELLGTFDFGDDYHTGSITAATISKDKSKVALLTHKIIYVFEDFKGDDFFSGKLTKINMEHISQKESIVFKDDNTFYVGEESEKGEHPLLYEIKIQD